MADQIIQGQQPSTILVQKSDSQKSIRPGFVKVLVAILFMLLCPLLFFELFNISLQESQLKFWIIFVTFIISFFTALISLGYLTGRLTLKMKASKSFSIALGIIVVVFVISLIVVFLVQLGSGPW